MASNNGATSKYRPEYCDKAREISKSGTTNDDLAAGIGVGTSSIDRWLAKYPQFRAAVEDGRGVADKNVEFSLYQRAIGGYSYEERKEHRNARGEVTRVEVNHKHLAPDTLAQIFWLKNRQPEMWRDRRELDMKGGVSVSDLAERLDRARDMSDQAKVDRINELMERARVQEEYEKRLRRGDLAATKRQRQRKTPWT